MRHGIFELVNPPDDVYRDDVIWTIDNIDYPWHRLLKGLWKQGKSAINVVWVTPNPGGALGTYGGAQITLGYQFGYSGQPFTFAHEVGHAVDELTLSPAVRTALMDYWHQFRCRYHYPDVRDPNPPYEVHEWSHEKWHHELWSTGWSDYLFRHHEAYADAFVAAFCPVVWEPRGSYGRFVHWPSDYTQDPPVAYYESIRTLTLMENIMTFNDVPSTHPQHDDIMWMATNGITQGYPDPSTPDPNDRIFKPADPVSRAHMATFMHRLFTLMGGVG